jgi:hypothetical protein
MADFGEFERILVHAKLVACAHSCKYCLMGKKRLAKITPARFIGFVERFLEWERKQGSDEIVGYVPNYTSDHNRETLELLKDVDERFPRRYSPLRGITLGGLPMRTESELLEWLTERQSFGCETAHGSLAGTGKVHDYWNGQSGNYELIMTTMRIAGEIGMALGARMFVAKSTLSLLQELNDDLERLPKHEADWRYATPFFYAGWGARLEEERIDEDERDALPKWLEPMIRRSTSLRDVIWRSEREWIETIRDGKAQPSQIQLILNINDDNIDRLEGMSCDAIVAEYRSRTQAAYAAIPSLTELCERYGDRNDRRVYILQRCIQMKWLDLHLRDYPTRFERQLTHLQMGN